VDWYDDEKKKKNPAQLALLSTTAPMRGLQPLFHVEDKEQEQRRGGRKLSIASKAME